MALEKATATITDETPLIPQDVTDIKTELELQNVDNTSDANKPVSTAQQTALNDKLGNDAGTNNVMINTWSGTEAQYQALPTKDNDVYYFTE